MGDKRNFAVLEWVIGEINDTLNEARNALEAYVENPKDSTRMRFCLTHIHQVHGSLQMVEFHGASLLAEEMEQLAQAIVNNNVSNGPEAHEVLMRSLLQLPTYLEHVKLQKEDHPGVVLPLLNDLRAVRKQSYLSETNLFSPDLSAANEPSGERHPITTDNAKLAQILKKLREMYQFSAASVLRGIKVDENFVYLEKVCTRLEVLTRGTACHPIWEVSSALIDGLRRDDIELSVAVRGLLRYLARELRILGEKSPASLDAAPNESLLKNLLYYIARADDGSKRIAAVTKKYKLSDALLAGAHKGSGDDGMSVPDPEAIRSVVVALQDELNTVKHILDLSMTGQSPPEDLKQILPVVKRVGDTLAVLGIGDLRKQVIEQANLLEQMCQQNSIDENDLMQVAGKIIEVEHRLEAISKVVGRHRDLSTVNEREIEIDYAKRSVLKECKHGLEKTKEAIVEYISSKWNPVHLQNIDTLLTDIRGGLDMVPLARPASILESCNRFIQENLLNSTSQPSFKTLDTLADAIASVEYFIERISDDLDEDVESLLDIAEESVAQLGYGVADSKAAIDRPKAETLQASEAPAANKAEFVSPATEATNFSSDQEEQAEYTRDESVSLDAEPEEPSEEREIAAAYDDVTEDATAGETDGEAEVEVEEEIIEAPDQAAAQQSSATISLDMISVDDDESESDIDDEIIEIFIEEAGEVLETLEEYFPKWKADPKDNDSLVIVRRAFHTLKGSGRMVEASDIGELAWSVENMLNRVIDKTVNYQPAHSHLIIHVLNLLPVLIKAFEKRKANPRAELTEQYRLWGHELSEGTIPPQLIEEPMLGAKVEASFDEAVAAEDQPPPDAEQAEEETDTPVEEISMSVPMEEASEEEEIIFEPIAEDFSAGELEEDEDLVLWEIFSSEAKAHLLTLQNFINDMEEAAPLYSPPSDELQRALHTLKGSAKMAQVTPIARMAEPLESFTKEMISYQVPINADILQLIKDTVTYTNEGLDSIDSGRAVEIPKLDQFLARTAELRDLAVGHLIRLKELEKQGGNRVDPRLLSIFMAEEMKLLLDADVLLRDWRASGQNQHIPNLINELTTLETGALQANLPDMARLSRQLSDTHQAALDGRLQVDDDFFEVLTDGHNKLLDMVDAVAAGQNVVPPSENINAALESILAGSAPAVGYEVTEEPGLAEDFSVESSTFEYGDYSESFTFEDADTAANEEVSSPNEGMSSDEEVAIDPDVGDTSAEPPIEFEESAIGWDTSHLEVSDEDEETGEALDTSPEAQEQSLEFSGYAEEPGPEAGDAEEITFGELPEQENKLAEELFLADQELPEISGEHESVHDQDFGDFDFETPTQDVELEFEAPELELGSTSGELDNTVESEKTAEPENAEPEKTVESVDTAESHEPHQQTPEIETAASSGDSSIPGLLDTIDVNDEEFDEDILDVFLEEAEELIEELDEAVHAWELDWSNLDSVEQIKRALHTLKGGARLAGMTNLGELTHEYESYLIGVDVSDVDGVFFARIHDYQDKVLRGVRAIQRFISGGGASALATEDIGMPAAQTPEVTDAQDAHAPTDDQPAADDGQKGQSAATNVLPFAPKPKESMPAVSGDDDGGGFAMPTVRGGGGRGSVALKKSGGPQEVIKVSADLLEELVNLAGETSISRGRLEQQITDFGGALTEIDATIARLQEQLRRLDIETEAQVLFRQEQIQQTDKDFDPLEMDRYSHLQQLSRSLIESASDLADLRATLTEKVRDTETLLLQQSRINSTLQEGLMRSRMVPFSRMVPRLRRIVRQVATEVGKKVSFELDNVEGELDRSVLERMVAPLEHMLRNAVDHGIEKPDDRVAAGKPETGRIVLSLGREGGDVILRLVDDGRGIDLKRVRAKAVERGLMSADAELSDHDIMQFILHAGFSTAESVTQISGRGVGMDVVSAEIKQLGGSVSINSRWGQGTEFYVRLPFTVSVNRALMIALGNDFYAVPLNTIEGIVRVSPFELEHYYTDPDSRFEYAGERYQVRYLGNMLNTDLVPRLEGQSLPLPVILVRSAEHTMALQVDALLGSREIVVKSLGQQFSLVQGLSGATVMGDGSVVVILDPHALVRKEMALASAQIPLMATGGLPEPEEDDTVPTIMVVDDSVTVRKVTSRFLEREGFEVITAKDGVDALQVLQDRIPDLMLLDIEMPRMDGFEVAKNVRGSRRWKGIPIIMITSRTGDKHKDHALSLGVDNYLGKPYQEDLLLESINELLAKRKKGR